MTVNSTTQTTATTTAQYSTTQITASSDFDETLNQTQNTTQASTEPSEASKEAYFKNVERVSYDFIKNLNKDDIDEIYADIPKEERSKYAFLHNIANLSENETLNKVMFEEAKDKSSRDALSYYFGKWSEMSHYERMGTGQRFVLDTTIFKPDGQGRFIKNTEPIDILPSDYKLSHNKAFDFLLDMVNSSKDGMNNINYSDEVKKMYEEVFVEYSDLLEKYNSTLRKNLTGNV